MTHLCIVNPFAKRETHDKRQLLIYKILTIVSWLLVVLVSISCSFPAAERRTIWGQNKAHPTPFSLNPVITDIYWYVLGDGLYLWRANPVYIGSYSSFFSWAMSGISLRTMPNCPTLPPMLEVISSSTTSSSLALCYYGFIHDSGSPN